MSEGRAVTVPVDPAEDSGIMLPANRAFSEEDTLFDAFFDTVSGLSGLSGDSICAVSGVAVSSMGSLTMNGTQPVTVGKSAAAAAAVSITDLIFDK